MTAPPQCPRYPHAPLNGVHHRLKPARVPSILSEQITYATKLYHMIGMPKFTQDEMNLLDKRSTDNMLVYYEEELRRIAGGERPASLLSRPLINRFLNLGVLDRDWGGRKWKVTLSQKGRERYGLPT